MAFEAVRPLVKLVAMTEEPKKVEDEDDDGSSA